MNRNDAIEYLERKGELGAQVKGKYSVEDEAKIKELLKVKTGSVHGDPSVELSGW